MAQFQPQNHCLQCLPVRHRCRQRGRRVYRPQFCSSDCSVTIAWCPPACLHLSVFQTCLLTFSAVLGALFSTTPASRSFWGVPLYKRILMYRHQFWCFFTVVWLCSFTGSIFLSLFVFCQVVLFWHLIICELFKFLLFLLLSDLKDCLGYTFSFYKRDAGGQEGFPPFCPLSGHSIAIYPPSSLQLPLVWDSFILSLLHSVSAV